MATEFRIECEAQDRMALASQRKAIAAQKSGFFDAETVSVKIPQSFRRGAAAAAFLAAFVEEMKASGFVAAALAQHGIQGASVAPPV